MQNGCNTNKTLSEIQPFPTNLLIQSIKALIKHKIKHYSTNFYSEQLNTKKIMIYTLLKNVMSIQLMF